MIEAARLILPHIHIMKDHSKDGGPLHTTVSGILLPHLVESMISSGALEVLITDKWRYQNEFYDVLSDLPNATKKYIRVVEHNPRIGLISDQAFEPILEELGITIIGVRYTHDRDAADDKEKLMRGAAMEAHIEFPRFLEALFYKSQFHFNMPQFLKNLEILKSYSRSAENRIRLSSLIAILSTYETNEIATATVIPSASQSQSDRLMGLLLSYEFEALSQSHSMLGRITNIPHIVSQIKLRAGRLLRRKEAKGIIGYASKTASVASGVPIPNTDLAESLLKEQFLPPTLDMSVEILRAKNELIKQNPDTTSLHFIGLPTQPA